MNFKDLQFNIGKLSTNVKSHVAKNNPLQNPDTRALNLWLFEERDDLSNMRTNTYHHAETNKAFLDWVKEELVKNKEDADYSQDIEDVGSALYTLLNKQVELERQYNDRYQLYRRAIKSMKDKELELNDLKEKKQSLEERIKHLKKSNPASKKLYDLEATLFELENEQDKENVSSTDFRRFILKEAFYLRFNALQEFSEKNALIAGFGKFLIDLLDNKHETQENESSDMILMDALLTVDGWQSSDQRHTLTKEDDLLTSEDSSDDATLLTDHDLLLQKTQQDMILKKEELNEKSTDDYYNQLYKRVSLQKRPISSHRSYAEFQTQFNLPPTSTDSPPAYKSNEAVNPTDEKKI
ncbi:Eisosome component PIL1-domain-containing protein [Mucor mucedo]|uniref:Eisosome component PIL1-domain-containing protein n=1 Tax=Mucor mucedo TaxID=29922 RepID=UPI00221FAF03|nr:Eisosome component PIL1-domain-containing protein [Mucor mucedo]KAI7889685.1 Eisosome component PIL1-domain-containing protein [Mucor mucedo]